MVKFFQSCTLIFLLLSKSLNSISINKELIPKNGAIIVDLNITTTNINNKSLGANLLLDLCKEAANNFSLQSDFIKTIVCRDKNENLLSTSVHWDDDWQTSDKSVKESLTFLPKKYKNGCRFETTTKDNVVIEGVFHDRESDTLVVVAPGFNNFYKQFCPVLWFFEKADIAFFNFRGHFDPMHNKKQSFIQRQFHLCFDSTKTSFGNLEEEDVTAVTECFKKQKKYKKIIGLGFCFGAAMIVKAQSKNKNLFTHLILDSLWPNSKDIFKTIFSSKFLIGRVSGLTGALINFGYKNNLTQKLIFYLKKKILCNSNLNKNINICSFLKNIKIPTVFIHGINDELINTENFIELLSNTHPLQKKIGIVTNEKHLRSFLNCRLLYKTISETLFLQDFIHLQQKLSS